MISRETSPNQQIQGIDEEIVYTITTTNWGGSPTSESMVVKDVTVDNGVVTDEVTTGEMSVSGDVITLKTIKALTIEHRYRVEVQFTSGGSVFECYFHIRAEE